MAFLMVCPMALIMLFFMRHMYKKRGKNAMIISFSILIFFISLLFLRKQILIEDTQYMKAMIPHHSSAILTSKNANLKDPEVKKLSLDIIRAQEEEIAKMKAILKRLE